jgi:mRNA-degrading endonuclease RelE of RelBE toxin-antitoxin system
LTLYSVEFDPRTESELRALPPRTRRLIFRQLEYLRAAPFRSHPGVLVKATKEAHGVWHFHAAKDVRVYYMIHGPIIRVLLVERSAGVNQKTVDRPEPAAR